jgi:hypothetical protein
MEKDLSYYHQLPYTRVVTREEYEGETWFAVAIREIPDVVAAGKTRTEGTYVPPTDFGTQHSSCQNAIQGIPPSTTTSVRPNAPTE